MFNELRNFSVYVDGANYVGKVTKGTLPKITPKLVEHYGAGMAAPVDIDTGKVEKMEATFEITGIQKELYNIIGNKNVPVILRGVRSNDSGESETIIAEMRGNCSEVDNGDFEPDSKGQTNIKISCNYYSLSIGGEVVVEIDAINGIRKIKGVNQMSAIV